MTVTVAGGGDGGRVVGMAAGAVVAVAVVDVAGVDGGY